MIENQLAAPRIVCAANRMPDGYIVLGARHYDKRMRETISKLYLEYNHSDVEQGFIDQFGNFHNRKDAMVIAIAANQIYRRCGGDEEELYSENLY